ncbi:MAG: VWA domain-containing protein [Candidatus Thiodiazotropha sp. (ex Ctena orbiculata)]|nr:VWA domain-containing protein [Candidatus Thiodiazotropha taylori]MBT2998762.1 VWA domain-containing protein [Candidatus Thiodiazotropha taylori]MBT2999576.1 VWA domain-containing protein [Candidatus Thiodiazotropha taylori]MBV2108921.1 VWA domain-containing protein [Candidatus Thiodiazotropha taylori]MBV2113215.1 VWA domain-containing protein [Candidatus Thiodiazotropha taylori]
MSIMNRPYPVKQLVISLGTTLAISLMSTLATADDIEIYLQEPPDPVPPNVLFVLDESGSMSSGRPSRRDRLEEAMRTLINDPDMGNVNAALLGYTTRWGNNGTLYLRAHSGNFSIIEDNRTMFLNAADNLQTISYTPTVKAMEAAVNWFRRDRTFVDYNGFITTSPIDGVPQDNWCRPNHMVVLTDGRPNSNSPTSGQAYGLTEYPTGTTCASDSTSNWQNGRCAREIAGWAYTTDMETGDGWDEVQNIVTHTIGFDTNDPAIENFMRSIATAGGGSYYPATSVSDLVTAFTSIVTEAQQSIPYAYTVPVVPFNQDNAAVSGNRIFVPTLVPAAEVFWTGNLKSYTISTSTSGGATAVVITDADGDPIVNDRYEFVSSRDHWNSTGEDGGNPLVGGAAEQMTAGGSRNLYTNTNPSAALSHASNRVHRDNDLVTYALLGVADGDDATREALLNWISWDPTLTGDASHEGEMGAPIHTQPAVMEYNSGDVIFLPTTEGVLEAIDEETGQELWAFMPSDLLGGIQTIFNNNPSSIPYYGLDGPLTVYETQGRKMAIVGMRRGGRNYYMLDITDRENPSFVATVNAASGLSRLGQTWSKPLFVTMEIGGGSARDVLVFGGGYDPDQDSVTTNRVNDDEGNAIYIIDARDGSLVTTISSDGSTDLTISDMRNSIAGNLLPVDINANNVIDRLYATDVGGRVIRVDIPDGEFADTSMAGGIIADVYTPGELRKFFNTPEVGYYNIGSTQYLAILVGSGNRSNPLDVSVTDRFYMIKDPGVWTKPITYVTVAHDELYDATANLVQDGTADQQGAARNSLALLKGWFIDLGYSEKSYSKAVLYDYLVLFTTFSAERSAELAACEARGASGVGRAYAVNMRDASAVIDGFGGSQGTLDRGDRTKVLSMLGIPPSPTLVFPEGDQAATLGNVVKALVGLEEVAEWPERLRPISWEEVIE